MHVSSFPVILAALVMFLAGPADAMTPIDPDGMMSVVNYLSGKDLKGRGLGTRELDQAAAVIAQRFEDVGLLPGGTANGSWYQEWVDPELKIVMRNVVGVLPGKNPLYAGQSVILGAHYDHLGTAPASVIPAERGQVHPGADDNASGVAVLLELASRLPLAPTMERGIVFVAFTGEEAGRKGSRHYVENERRYPVSRAVGMINLDTVGRLGRNKLIVLGAGTAKEWAQLFREIGKAERVEIATSDQQLDSSDHVSFQEAGVPAVQLFTGPHLDYHRPTDTADKIDGKGLAKIATVAHNIAFYLANDPAPLTATVQRPSPRAEQRRDGRKVTIGVVPDFTYNENGVRLGGTVPGGPAELAGMREGDVIFRIGATPIVVLKDLSEAIRASAPGDRLTVIFKRNGKEHQTIVEVRGK
jgi:hypothetical protein